MGEFRVPLNPGPHMNEEGRLGNSQCHLFWSPVQTRTPPRPTTVGALLAAVAALTLVGCDPSVENPQAGTSPPASVSPGASPSPSPVAPADGTDLDARTDGEGEVGVTGVAEFELDPDLGLDAVTVELIPAGADPEFGTDDLGTAEPSTNETMKFTTIAPEGGAITGGVLLQEVGGTA
ncbi:hypothetical protein ACFWTE_23695 [Nocardiopsis sp. NPDC058631]|uniref:hypothetical protein n=1 Tax=Nocardiopsis sp. NPDC058631 TaxID=3346566 RepID=UPI003669D320